VLAVLALLGLGVYFGGRQLRAEYHYRAAVAALDRYDYPDAKKHLGVCLEVWPDGPGTRLLAARIARREGGQLEGALREAALQEAAELLRRCRDLGCPPEAVELEHLLLRGQRRNPPDPAALAELRARAAAGGPETPQILEVLIQSYMDTYRLGEALIALNRLLELRPGNIPALIGRGKVHEWLLDFSAAAADYREAVRLDPENEKVRRYLAEMLLITGPPAEALAQFEWLRRRQRVPVPEVLLGLARSRRQLRQFEQARALLDRLLAEAPEHAAALAERGKMALEQDSLEEAERWLKKAARSDPFSRDVHYNLAQCLLRADRPKEAEPYLARYRTLDADLKRLDRLTRRVIDKPADADLRCEVGEICLRNGGVREGVGWLKSALLIAPGHPRTHAVLARHYRAAGQVEQAEWHERRAGQKSAGGADAKPPEPAPKQPRGAQPP
jgi:predicted Zn-dependent protease